jgi:anti-anti-sigma factor
MDPWHVTVPGSGDPRRHTIGHRGPKHDMIGSAGGSRRSSLLNSVNRTSTHIGMIEGHRLHEARIEGGRVDPAGAFTVEDVPAPEGIRVVALAGELDMAATSAVRSRVDAAAGSRGLVIDLAEVTFIDSSMLKELLRAGGELGRYETRLVLAAVPPSVQRLFDLTRTTELFAIAPDRDAALRSLES